MFRIIDPKNIPQLRNFFAIVDDVKSGAIAFFETNWSESAKNYECDIGDEGKCATKLRMSNRTHTKQTNQTAENKKQLQPLVEMEWRNTK